MSTDNLHDEQAAQADFPYGADDPFADGPDPFAVHGSDEIAPNANAPNADARNANAQQSEPEQPEADLSEPEASVADLSEAEPKEQSFFQKAARFMEKKGCNLNMMLTSNGDGRVRLTVTGQRVASDEEDNKSSGPPFQPFTVLDAPKELDAGDGGLASFLNMLVDQELTLQQVRARADEAHKKAEKAEKKREKEAKERQKKASPGGPLFSGADD